MLDSETKRRIDTARDICAKHLRLLFTLLEPKFY